MTSAPDPALEAATAEIEAHVAAAGWDRPPTLFALVSPDLAGAEGGGLTPVEQEALPDGPLDEALAQIGWPPAVAGCALSQEIVILPTSAEAELPEDGDDLAAVANHPERREARLVVAVLRDQGQAAMLRLRGRDGEPDGELLTGSDLAPNLAEALLATLDDED